MLLLFLQPKKHKACHHYRNNTNNIISDTYHKYRMDFVILDFQNVEKFRNSFCKIFQNEPLRDKLQGIKPYRFRIALKMIRVIRVICEICGLKGQIETSSELSGVAGYCGVFNSAGSK